MTTPVGADAPFQPRRPGLQSRVWRELTRLAFRYMANPALPAEVRRHRTEWLTRPVRLPSGTRVEAVMAGGVPAEWVVPPGVDPNAVLLYLHGGGYVAGSPTTHRPFVARLNQSQGEARMAVISRHVDPGVALV
jgi:acetyl esterase/lipase